LTPAVVPLHDNYATAVLADGSGSNDALDFPDGGEQLLYFWDCDDPRFVMPNDVFSPSTTIRVTGERPATVTLIVQDGDGLRSTAMAVIGLSVP
jgi:hypothetical protein